MEMIWIKQRVMPADAVVSLCHRLVSCADAVRSSQAGRCCSLLFPSSSPCQSLPCIRIIIRISKRHAPAVSDADALTVSRSDNQQAIIGKFP